jgi:hypothetical protein
MTTDLEMVSIRDACHLSFIKNVETATVKLVFLDTDLIECEILVSRLVDLEWWRKNENKLENKTPIWIDKNDKWNPIDHAYYRLVYKISTMIDQERKDSLVKKYIQNREKRA